MLYGEIDRAPKQMIAGWRFRMRRLYGNFFLRPQTTDCQLRFGIDQRRRRRTESHDDPDGEASEERFVWATRSEYLGGSDGTPEDSDGQYIV